MATVLENILPKSSALLCIFYGQKNWMQSIFITEMLPVCCGKCLERKAVDNWVGKFSQGRFRVADNARSVEEVAEKTVKRLLRCGFRRTGKTMAHVSHVLRFMFICDLFTDSSSYISFKNFTYAIFAQQKSSFQCVCIETVRSEI
jgi:hypothetical protein